MNVFSQSRWISSPVTGGPFTSPPASFFRKPFSLHSPIRQASLRITALGLYECEINGQRVGNQVLSPGWTDYHKRVYFQEYDVTDLVKEGPNAMGVILGDGWFSGRVCWGDRQVYGMRPQFIAEMDISLQDGARITVVTDASWLTTIGPILENDLLGGESYDARCELPNWSAPSCGDSQWQPVSLAETPSLTLEKSPAPPMRRMHELSPQSIVELPSAWPKPLRLFDFGQNFAGRIRLAVKAPSGRALTITYAEILNPDGTPYTENLRTAKATDHYTCKGGETETWEPRFTFHGFRYAAIAGLQPEDEVSLTGIVIYSDMKPSGSFSCSNPLLNQLQSNIVWGQRSNFLDVPTDCPQRDERLGWTGDAQVFVRTAAFNMQVRDFFRKWMQDVRDAQRADGSVPPVVPQADFIKGLAVDGGPAWADATIICPWTIYRCYADREILALHYDSMRKYMDFLAAHRCIDRIRSHPDIDSWGGFGDWLALDGSGKTEGGTPRDLIGTAFYAYDAEIMAKIATVLGRDQDAADFRALHEKIVSAFQYRFITPAGLLTSGTQTAYVLALHFGLVPEKLRPVAARELVRDIERRDFHLATGFVGTPYLLDVLETEGCLDVAYRLLEQETFPSWLFPIKNGATTIWERWDGWTPEKGFQDKGMNSFNHYAYGAVGAWMYRTVAGIDLDTEIPGYQKIIFRPRPGGSLTAAQASLETPFGLTSISWQLREAELKVQVLVPPDTQARFDPPQGYGGSAIELEAGQHNLLLARV